MLLSLDYIIQGAKIGFVGIFALFFAHGSTTRLLIKKFLLFRFNLENRCRIMS